MFKSIKYLILLVFFALTAVVALFVWQIISPLEVIERLGKIYPISTFQKGVKVVQFKKKKPSGWVTLEQIPPKTVAAFVISEDWAFYQHDGFDANQIVISINEAIRGKRRLRGASTITQQVAKNLFLTSERSFWRKAKEFVFTVQLEKAISKQRILEIYLNNVELGPRIFGIKKASQYYFGKSPSMLSLKESAFLAMLLPSPIRYGTSFRQKKLTKFAESSIESILQKLNQAKVIDEVELEAVRTIPIYFRDARKQNVDVKSAGTEHR